MSISVTHSYGATGTYGITSTQQKTLDDFNAENKISQSDWNKMTGEEKKYLLDKHTGSDFTKLFDFKDNDVFKNSIKSYLSSNGYFLSGDNIGKYNEGLYQLKKDLEAQGFTVNIDTSKSNSDKATIKYGDITFKIPVEYDDDGNIKNAGDLLNMEKYNKLTFAQQEKLFDLWNKNILPDDFLDDEVGAKFDVKALHANNDFSIPNQTPALPKPNTGTLSFRDLFQYDENGKLMGNPALWGMGLMSMMNSISVAQTKHIETTMTQSMDKDEYYFQKALVVNKKMYLTIATQNKKIVDAHNLQAKKKNFWQRLGGIFKSLFTGKIIEAIKEAASLIYDCTIGLITKLVKTVLSGAATIVFLCMKAHYQSNGDFDKVKAMDEQIKALGEQLKDEWTFTKTYSDSAAIKKSMAESEAMEKELNTLTAEEAMYVTIGDLGFMDMVNEQAQFMVSPWMQVINGIMGGIGMATGLFFGGVFGVFGALQNLEQMEQVQTANAYALESQQQAMMLRFRSGQVEALQQTVQAFRQEISADMDLLGKDLEMTMEVLKTMEDMLNDLISTAMSMGMNAAKGSSA